MDYNAPSGSTDTNADYVGATASTQGSKIPPNVPTLTQREIVGTEMAAGIVPSNGDRTQLAQSIGRGLWVGPLGASPNALTGTVGGGAVQVYFIQTVNTWTKLRGIAAQTNTSSAVTVTIAGVGSVGGMIAGTLLRQDGRPLGVGDVPVGVPFEFQPDAAGNFRMVGAVASEASVFSSAVQRLTTIGASIFQAQRTALHLFNCFASAGGGGYAGTSTSAGGGGGAGGFDVLALSLIQGQQIPIYIPPGGLGGVRSTGALATAGGTVSVNNQAVATGGSPGVSAGAAGQAGGGGSGGIGLLGLQYAGGPGYQGYNGGFYAGGQGGTPTGLGGGFGGQLSSGNGNTGTGYGAGGSGASNSGDGGAGAQGLIIVQTQG